VITPPDDIAAHTYNRKIAKHLFCPNCGVASFYIRRSDPDSIDVNVRCLEGVNLSRLRYDHFDGRNWERSIVGYKEKRVRGGAAKWGRTNYRFSELQP